MKTITFYSYKGGVGRTLTLSNIAVRLSELGKKVCLLDFDLEAPGIPFKFKSSKLEIKSGIVDYIFEFSNNGILPENIEKYSTIIPALNSNFSSIHLIPAGNIESNEYWKKVSMIDWAKMFYSENGKGVRFILDMKEKIEKEINPDVLLVDSRTGITDISGITLKLLADEVVLLSSYNDEGLFGSTKIIESLTVIEDTLMKNTPKINFVLTRLPFSNEPSDKIKEDKLIQKVYSEINKNSNKKDISVSVIHSDRRLEENEKQLIGYEYEVDKVSVSNDYLKLFDKLTSDILSKQELILFTNKKKAEREFNKSLNEKDSHKKLKLLSDAIEFDPTNWVYFYNRGVVYSELFEYRKAIKDFTISHDLNSQNSNILSKLGYCYGEVEEIDKAIFFSKRQLILILLIILQILIFQFI